MAAPALQLVVDTGVLDFIRRQAPEPRRLLRDALRKLEREEGDIKALQGDLVPYFRLRAGGFRIIFRYGTEGKRRFIHCPFAERRSIVYEIFATMVADRLSEKAEAEPVKGKPRPVKYRIPRRKKPPAKPKSA